MTTNENLESKPNLRLITPATSDNQAFPENPVGLSIWAMIAALGTYFCMYGFRKPFTAGTYEEITFWGFGYKTVLVTAQVLGYTLSKFIGVRVIAEMKPERRIRTLWMFIGIAQVSLLLFALIPAPWNFFCLFLNGLPLGMVFGLVLGWLEGRRVTEILTAGLCASFILADGVTKSVGAFLLASGVTQFWMPFAAGLVFALPLLMFSWMLTLIPPPSSIDIAHRNKRIPMTHRERKSLFWKYATGLTLLIGVYLLLTILRSIRADFASEIWNGLGFTGQPSVFVNSEIFVMFGVVVINGLAVVVRNNRRAFFTAMGVSLFGFLLISLSLLGLRNEWLDGFSFMVLIGLGLYLPYVAVHTTIFERLIAMTEDTKGNIGFLMYLADSFGYLGYAAVMLGRNLIKTDQNFLTFFISLAGAITFVATSLLIGAWIYFANQTRTIKIKSFEPRSIS